MIEQIKLALGVTAQDETQEVILKRKGPIFYLLLNRKANSFTHSFVRAIHEHLVTVEAAQGEVALVTVSLSKLFSGGLDLKYASNLEPFGQRFFVLEFINLLGRLSVIGVPTIALVKGGAVAGGCMFAFAHDYIMVAETAVFACNEVSIGLPLPPGMMAIIKKKHRSHASLRDMVLTGRKFNAKEALSVGMVDAVVPQAEAWEKANSLAKSIAEFSENRVNFKKLKQELHKDIIDACFNKQHAVGTVGEVQIPQLPRL